MRNLIRGCLGLYRNLSAAPVILLLQIVACLLSPNRSEAQAPKILLEQSANGPADAPQSPEWTRNHINKNNSHYAPGSVIPYRAIVTNAPTNCPLKIRLNFLAVKNCRHAMDFPTNYNQFTEEHFLEFGNWQPVDPLAGLTDDFSGPANIEFPVIPVFVIQGPPADQNTNKQNNEWFLAKYGTQSLSAWNAELSGIEFIGFSERNNTDCISNGNFDNGCNCIAQQAFEVSFTATNLPVVFAWGGHASYDTLTIDRYGNYGYLLNNATTERGSSGADGLSDCLSLAQAAAAGVGGGGSLLSFTGGTGDITYSLSGGKPINPTSSNRTDIQGEQIAERQKPSVFPNPNNGSATVMLPHNAESFDIRLIDISGKIIKSWNDHKNQRLELTALRPGMYFLNIVSRDLKNRSILKVVVLN
jgi:hypothetical protein